MRTRRLTGSFWLWSAALAILTPASAAGPAGFAGADLDRNGIIDYEEFRTHMVNTFYRADPNRDGVLAGTELNLLNPDRMPDADTNNDGKLDLKEFLNSTGADFRSADRNRDNVLDANEINNFNR